MASRGRCLCVPLWLVIAVCGAHAAPSDAVRTWLQRLRSPYPSVRLGAAYRIEPGADNSGDTLKALLEALHDPDPFVRRHVAAVVGDLPGHAEAVVPALAAMLHDHDPDTCAQAALALAKRGPPAIPALIRLLHDTRAIAPDLAIGMDLQTGPSPSDYAAVALARMDAPVFPALADAYLETRTRYVALGLGSAAKPFDHPTAQRPGDPAYIDRERSVKRAFSPMYFRELIEHIMACRPHALDLPAVRAYLERADPKDTDLGVLTAQIDWGTSRDALELLVTAFHLNPSGEVRLTVINELAYRRWPAGWAETTPIPSEGLQDNHADVREMAAVWVRGFDSRPSPGPLSRAILRCVGDAAPAVRKACIDALHVAVQNPQTDEGPARLLVTALKTDPSRDVRSEAALVLGSCAFPFLFVQEALLDAARDEKLVSNFISDSALAHYLEQAKAAPSVLNALISRFGDADPKLRERAIGLFDEVKPLPQPAVDALAAALRRSCSRDGPQQEGETAAGERIIRVLANGAPDDVEATEAFAEVLRLAARRPSPHLEGLARQVLTSLDKRPLPTASLRTAIVAYGEAVDAAAAASLLAKSGEVGFAVLMKRIVSVRAEDETSWFPCAALRAAPAADKAKFAPRLLEMARADNTAASACAAAALAGTSEERASLGLLLAQYGAMRSAQDKREKESEFLEKLIENPAWDWISAVLDQIEAGDQSAEPLANLFESEALEDYPGEVYGAILKRAAESRTGRLCGVAMAVLQTMFNNKITPEGNPELAAVLAGCIANPGRRERALDLAARVTMAQPEFASRLFQASPGLEAALAADLGNFDPGVAEHSLSFLARVPSPSRATVDAVKGFIESGAGAGGDRTRVLRLGCMALVNWGVAGAAMTPTIKGLLADKNESAPWEALQALALAAPADPELPALFAELALRSKDVDLREAAAEKALGLTAQIAHLTPLFETLVLDQKIHDWIAQDLDDVANALRPFKMPHRKGAGRPPGLPPFPWPPPRWSYLGVFGRDCPRTLLGDDNTTLAEVYQRFYNALKAADPNFETGLFGAPGGFALLVKPQRVQEDGTPLSLRYRWSEGKVPPLSVSDYIAYLFTQPVGFFRTIALIVTDQAQFQGGIQALPDYSSGGAVLPDEIGKQLLKDKHVFALIYSWKREWGHPPTLVSRELSALTHLEKSGFIDALRQARN